MFHEWPAVAADAAVLPGVFCVDLGKYPLSQVYIENKLGERELGVTLCHWVDVLTDGLKA
jgi:hypothetical protein